MKTGRSQQVFSLNENALTPSGTKEGKIIGRQFRPLLGEEVVDTVLLVGGNRVVLDQGIDVFVIGRPGYRRDTSTIEGIISGSCQRFMRKSQAKIGSFILVDRFQ